MLNSHLVSVLYDAYELYDTKCRLYSIRNNSTALENGYLNHEYCCNKQNGIHFLEHSDRTVYERWQQHNAALQCYTKALQIAERFRYLPEKTEPTRHLAYHALSKGDVNQALGYARQALTLREESGFKPYLPFDHLLLM